MPLRRRTNAKGKLYRNADALSYLLRAGPKVRRVLIKEGPKELVNTLCECVLNVLKGNVPVTSVQKRRLAKYKKDLRKLVDKRVNVTAKKRVLQKGGLFGVLIKALAPILSPIIGGLFRKQA
jgi:hypothetical protein